MIRTHAMPKLLDSQISTIKSDWNILKAQRIEILYNFLSSFPQNQAIFKAFNQKKLDTLKGENDRLIFNFTLKYLNNLFSFRFTRI